MNETGERKGGWIGWEEEGREDKMETRRHATWTRFEIFVSCAFTCLLMLMGCDLTWTRTK